jgi:hypothetical protein
MWNHKNAMARGWSIASAFRPVASVAFLEEVVVSIVVCHNSGSLHSQAMTNFVTLPPGVVTLLVAD